LLAAPDFSRRRDKGDAGAGMTLDERKLLKA
jgi:hypothetical protein